MPHPELAHGATGSLGPDEYYVQQLDVALTQAEAALAKASAAEGDGEDVESLAELELQLLERVASLRDVIVGLCLEHHCGHGTLQAVLGGKSTHLERAFAVLECAEHSALGGEDPRLQACWEACESAMHAMEPCSPTPRMLRSFSQVEASRESPVPPTTDGLQLVLGEISEDEFSEDGGAADETATLPSVMDEDHVVLGAGLPEARVFFEFDPDASTTRSENGDVTPQRRPRPAREYTPDQPKARRREVREHLLSNGGRYQGQMLGRSRDGAGIQVWPGGERYEGEFYRGGVHGEGVYSQPDGLVHSGQWARGKQHGQGAETLPDGSRYVGQYVTGHKSGCGVYTFAEGSVYEGEFLDDCIHGHGTYIWSGGGSGRKYHGQWLKNQMHGEGLFTFADGRRYIGKYMHDRKHGHGIFKWPDGCEYSGQWQRGRQHGAAQYRDSLGRVHTMKWSDGHPIA